MGDAEIRSIFKNDSVVGRHLDGDDDSEDNLDDDSDLDDDRTGHDATVHVDAPRPTTRYDGGGGGGGGSHNTGPKGVRSDARIHAAAQRDGRARMILRTREEEERMMRQQAAPWRVERDAEASASEARRDVRRSHHHDDDDDDDDEGSTGPGGLRSVDAMTYLDRVERRAVVLVYIHARQCDDESTIRRTAHDDGYVGPSARTRHKHNHDHEEDDREEREGREEALGRALVVLGKRYPKVTVMGMHCAQAEIDPVACPALLVYEAGELVANLMRVTDNLPNDGHDEREDDDDDDDDAWSRRVEAVLLRLGALRPAYRLDR